MKDLQEYLEHWFKERRVKKHLANVLEVREEIARLTVMIEMRQGTVFRPSEREKTVKMLGDLAAFKVRLAHLDAITRKVETPA